MDAKLFELYRDLLGTKFPDGRTVFDRIQPDDLCVAAHHIGKRFNNGLLIYGQAMNGWQNENTISMETLLDEVSSSADDYKEMYTMVDPDGWHGIVNGKPSSYYYKRSKFWKLNYQVITKVSDPQYSNFYISSDEKKDRIELLDNAWSQTAAWSNLFKLSYSEGGNPDDELIEVIRDISLRIILREIEVLRPKQVLFNTGEVLFDSVANYERNIFGLTKETNSNNIFYSGRYEYLPKMYCKMVVCRRPDVWRLHYTNSDIVKEATEIIQSFNVL